MTLEHCAAAALYISACKREHAQICDAFVQALDRDAKAAALGQGTVPLNDIDVCCVAEVIRTLSDESQLRVLVLEENSFGLPGVTALMEAIEANPNHIRELRLGKNNLKDQAAVVIGHTLSRSGCGLKVLDLSENNITKLGVIPIAAALQQPFCDIVELSFHNNKIGCDAASYLGQALRAAPKLKHLHLGYNALRDNGAAQIARSVPHAACLSTLDLTANRISREGGEELVRALMTPTCTVQRLNLRHNQLDSETIVLFADVIAHNTSLIQLFLGFMNPSPEAAAAVLSAIPQNHALLLLDIYGWKLNPKNTLALIQAVQEKNTTLAALVTDACEFIAPQVDEGNLMREERHDLHPIYVGPNDRDAYLATKSLRRYSRAQSRRQSRTASRVQSRTASRAQSRTRADGQPASRTGSSHRRSERGGSRPASISSRAVSPAEQEQALRSQCSTPRHSRRKSGSPRHPRHRHGESAPTDPAAATSAGALLRTPRSVPASTRSASRSSRAAAGHLVPVTSRSVDEDIDVLIDELQDTPGDPRTTKVLKTIIKSLHESIRQQRTQIQVLKTRVEALEARRECHCAGRGGSNSRSGTSPQRSGSAGNPTHLTGPLAKGGAAAASQSGTKGSSYHRVNSKAGMISYGKITATADANGDGLYAHYGHQNHQAQHNPAANSFQRSMSRMSQNTSITVMERCTTPHVSQDVPPDIAHPNDESGEHHPEGVELQRSAAIQSFPPRIEPSPSQDLNPPLRKSVSHAF
ncbi:Leucine Rich Repeat-containing protein / LRRP1 [Leishmania donovani]|uniref:Leucine_Rich_Repeat/Leucine_Rich_repeat_-_putative n=3 Tax=Leishmania donovani species complex TaxID=38574 RepID=A0A6L0XU97_LEIIN|nr:conserved hypothetical protein [Leishmania infantum JPCM5]XP_003862311.1 hypothetical protein, conserved [Leishmania donovani]CAC9504342.1 Leucine_Rich_Repeat/Leucine_Rich_repeat_-_putative [Leishmania infantum]AYU80366.1 Leucine Rich Repeat/Leucine Rich repeat, putative [Leishmania donovani]TPP40431.1 Leucine Rich repeat family protein [Leishmania donovani]TPP54340.1 Leucine Rich repeat family protein [Leishmania donovani]CAJ1990354.1 Leucine Rich Repeat-containing protein / LRRP1 [Leishm|eukprot:XP_001470238.1 conserved hypothetical protein [Leishmania infantum JPCM5]